MIISSEEPSAAGTSPETSNSKAPNSKAPNSKAPNSKAANPETTGSAEPLELSESPESPAPLEPGDSPCQLVCSMEPESGYCYGCGRTRDEIAYWPLKSREEREAILVALPGRMPPLREKLAQQRSKRRVNKRRRGGVK